MAADKKPEKKGKLKGIWNTYEKKGDTVVKKNKSCPKCGSGFSLANHKDRLTCGSCQYTEFTRPAPAGADQSARKSALPAQAAARADQPAGNPALPASVDAGQQTSKSAQAAEKK